jgi:competence protein ComEC
LFSIGWALQSTQLPVDGRDPIFGQREQLLEGTIDRVIRRTQRGFQLHINDVSVIENGRARKLAGRIQLAIGDSLFVRHLGRGMQIRVRASLRPSLRLVNPGVRSPAEGLGRKGIVAQGYVDSPASLFLLNNAHNSALERLRYRFRQWTAAKLAPDNAGLVQALTLGDRRAVSAQRSQAWRDAGLSHLLAISGLHVGMACWFVYRLCFLLLAWVSPLAARMDVGRLAAGLAILSAWAYVAVAGAPTSAIRAGWMITAFFGARVLGRDIRAATALCHAALCMCLSDPHCVLDPGCQLSFMAVGALIVGMPRVDERASWIREHMPYAPLSHLAAFCYRSIGATLLCTLGTLPVIVWTFQSLPLGGLVANIVAIPWVAFGLILPSMAVLSCTALSLSPPGLLENWLDLGGQWAHALAIGFANHLPTIELPGINLWQWIALSTAAVVCLVVFHMKRHRPAMIGVALLALVATATARQVPSSSQGRWVLTFLAVGHGDAVVLQMPGGFTLLVDTGGDPSGRFDVGRRIVVPALHALGVSKIDAILLTHPHPDHVGGLRAVVDEFEVGELWTNGCTLNAPGMGDFSNLRHRDLTRASSRHQLGRLTMQVLHPRGPRGGCYSALGANDNSLVIRLEFGALSVLLTGDVEASGERHLLRWGAHLKSTLLKVPHHGSRTSSTAAFLRAVDPQLAIGQSADQRPFPFPHAEVESRYRTLGIPLLVTGRHGAIQVRSDGQSWQLSRWK